jgi:UDP-GlcNAc:undecaprenyl-phosphate GlcNAc-1-phosphate transferase
VGSGVGITWITNPLGGQIRLDEIIIRFNFPPVLPFDLFSGPHSIVLLADIFAFIWIVWVMNALNWSSGVDGQLSGIVAIGLAAVGIAAAQFVSFDPSQIPVAALSFIAAGAYFGFLPWSFYPQKIMPGYGGATLGGMLLATLGILAGAKLATITLILIVPMIDGVWAILRRLLSGRSPVWGDREHLHHQLLALGWKKWQVAIFYYLMVGLFALLALTLDHRGRFFAITLGGMIILAALVTTAYLVKRFKNV